ncbi:MAG: hypothetical protein OJF50_005043 [Nitrospira sp.]|jgi:hypothetical protein|nr:hypothetical protein [Nitrospira sp.]
MPHYKGRQLETIANQREDGRWTCRYVIVDYTETVMDGNKGHADGSYATREERRYLLSKRGNGSLILADQCHESHAQTRTVPMLIP